MFEVKCMEKEFFIKLDYRCNNSCLFCSTGAKGNAFLSLSELKKLINTITPEEYDIVTLSGGEVTIRKDILEILEFIKTAGFKINIQTNARRFSNEEFTKQVSKIGIENFLISFHGHNKDLFENITRVEESFNETISGIINLKKHNQSIISNIVVSKLNYHNLYDIASLLCNLNIDAIKFVYIRAFGYAKERYSELCPSFNECTYYLSKALNHVVKNNKIALTEGIPFCNLQTNMMSVAGDLYIPNNVNFNDKHINEKKFAEYETVYHTKGEFCETCNFNILCKGPWKEYIDLYGYDELKPITNINPTDAIDINLLVNKMFY